MPITLSITDSGNGSSGTATIAGSGGGTVTVYMLNVSGGGWVSRGSRTGNGTVSVSPGAGYYLAYADGSPAASSVIGPLGITSGGESVYYQLASEAKAAVTAYAASLPDFPAANVYGPQWALDDKNVHFPAIFVTPPRGGSEQILGGTNLRDDWGKPLQISIVCRNHEDYTAHFNTYTLWRERLLRLFGNKRLSNVPELYRVVIQPLPIAEFLIDKFQYLISAFILLNQTREPRTP